METLQVTEECVGATSDREVRRAAACENKTEVKEKWYKQKKKGKAKFHSGDAKEK